MGNPQELDARPYVSSQHPNQANAGRTLKTIDVDDGLRKSLRSFLRQIMPDAPGDGPVRMFAGEFFGKRTGVRITWRPIGVAFQSDGRHGDGRTSGKALLQIVIFRLAFNQAEPPPVTMDHDGNMIRIVERCRTAIERGVIEVPLRRSNLPDKLGKIVPVFVVAVPTAFCGEI